MSSTTRKCISFFHTPHVSEDIGTVSNLFMELKDTSLANGHWVAIFETVNKKTFDNTEGIMDFILEDILGNANPQSSKTHIKTPCKQPKLQHSDFDININDEDSLIIKWWVWVEEYFKSAGNRLLDLEGHVGHPPAEIPYSTLCMGGIVGRQPSPSVD